MRGRLPEFLPKFSAEEIRQAQEVVRKPSSPQKWVWRARLALELAREPMQRSPDLGQRLGVHTQTVRKWRKRWATEGLCLEDKPRSGRPASFSPS